MNMSSEAAASRSENAFRSDYCKYTPRGRGGRADGDEGQIRIWGVVGLALDESLDHPDTVKRVGSRNEDADPVAR